MTSFQQQDTSGYNYVSAILIVRIIIKGAARLDESTTTKAVAISEIHSL
jgi:hypothetical protein